MHAVALVHFYADRHRAGSETMLHALLSTLVQHGHQATVITTQQDGDGDETEFEGVTVLSSRVAHAERALRRVRPDVVLTHHAMTGPATRVARSMRVPIVQLIHNNRAYTRQNMTHRADLYVFNSRWLRDDLARSGMHTVVVHPPVFADQHASTPGNKVTLVNLCPEKGSEVFYTLAARMPGTQFLGVEGGHSTQTLSMYPNVEFVRHTRNMRADVWPYTRVLLVPSRYESYGMVAVEALASGIPVIASPTPGLLESLDYAGRFVSARHVDGWERTLRALLKPTVWRSQSALARVRMAELDPDAQLKEFLVYMEALSAHDQLGFRRWHLERQAWH